MSTIVMTRLFRSVATPCHLLPHQGVRARDLVNSCRAAWLPELTKWTRLPSSQVFGAHRPVLQPDSTMLRDHVRSEAQDMVRSIAREVVSGAVEEVFERSGIPQATTND